MITFVLCLKKKKIQNMINFMFYMIMSIMDWLDDKKKWTGLTLLHLTHAPIGVELKYLFIVL